MKSYARLCALYCFLKKVLHKRHFMLKQKINLPAITTGINVENLFNRRLYPTERMVQIYGSGDGSRITLEDAEG